MRQSEKDKLKQFFNQDNNTYKFARNYIEQMNDSYAAPDWINEISNFITQDKIQGKKKKK